MSPDTKAPKPRKTPKRKTARKNPPRKPRGTPYIPDSNNPNKVGRPVEWTPERMAVAQAEIIFRVSGGEYISRVCDDEHMPGVQLLFKWRREQPEFEQQVIRAQDIGLEVRAERLAAIAENGSDDVRVVELPNGQFKAIVNSSAVIRDRLRVDTELKLLPMFRPKKYGQKLQHVGGDENDAPIRVETEVKPDRELAKAIASILARSQGSKSDG